MPRKPVDPVLQLAAAGELTEGAWGDGDEVSGEGLPVLFMVWRPVRIGELKRCGDYEWQSGLWREVGQMGEVGAGEMVRRPMGPDAYTWYVGKRGAKKTPNGSYEAPFETVEEALAAVPKGSAAVLVATGTHAVIGARDPESWDWKRYLGTDNVVDSVAQVVEDKPLNDNFADLDARIKAENIVTGEEV
jgi:hypothetical protein